MLVLSRHRNECIDGYPNESLADSVALRLSHEMPSLVDAQIDMGYLADVLKPILADLCRWSVMVVDIRGDKARLGFHASPCFDIHRREVAEAIARNEAAGIRPDHHGG